MALTPEQIYGLRVRSGMDAFRPMKEHWQAKDDDAAYRFARAIEAEVRKQDEALIQQMLEALEKADKISGYPNNRKVINAARARLAGGIFAPENAHLFTVEAALKAFAHVKPLGES